MIEIENQTNNPILFNDDYVAPGTSPLITGDAMWGNARTGSPLGIPELTLQFDRFFSYDDESGEFVTEVTEVSFDFAWASSQFDTLQRAKACARARKCREPQGGPRHRRR